MFLQKLLDFLKPNVTHDVHPFGVPPKALTREDVRVIVKAELEVFYEHFVERAEGEPMTQYIFCPCCHVGVIKYKHIECDWWRCPDCGACSRDFDLLENSMGDVINA